MRVCVCAKLGRGKPFKVCGWRVWGVCMCMCQAGEGKAFQGVRVACACVRCVCVRAKLGKEKAFKVCVVWVCVCVCSPGSGDRPVCQAGKGEAFQGVRVVWLCGMHGVSESRCTRARVCVINLAYSSRPRARTLTHTLPPNTHLSRNTSTWINTQTYTNTYPHPPSQHTPFKECIHLDKYT